MKMKYPYNVNYCGGKQQDAMIKRGWTLKLAQGWNEEQDGDLLYTRLVGEGYKQVKVYYSTTAIKGLHSNFAFVKR